MARYIALLKFTEQGAQNIEKSTARPRDESAALRTSLAALGNVRTQIMPAFVDAEFDEIIPR